ncbi:MAG: metallophosphoesterase [Thermoplasmata archaeon]
MKVLVISDLHGSDWGVRQIHSWIDELQPELLLACGDITHFGPISFAKDFFEGLDLRTLAIPGNCDPVAILPVLDELGVNLHERVVKVGDETFMGFGGSNPTPFDTPFEVPDDKIYESLSPLMIKDAVLVTHAPPHRTLDGTTYSGHLGSISIARIVGEFEPKLSVFGHIHEARGFQPGRPAYLNSGSAREGYGALLEIGESVDAMLLG